MQDPELLLVDEPVAGLTPQEIERTGELLLSLAGKHSVVVVEHDMDFVRSMALLHDSTSARVGSLFQLSFKTPRRRNSACQARPFIRLRM